MTQSDFNTISSRTLLHSSYVANDGRGNDAVIVSEIIENDKGETKPNLRIFKNPKFPFWLTQPQYRTYDDKKEFESIHHLDEYRVSHRDKDKEIFKLLNGYTPNFVTRTQRRELYQSPYLYGGNITPEAFVAIAYKKALLKAGKTPHSPTTGFFDIERSLLPSSLGKLPLMVFTAENHVFLAMKKSFMVEEKDGRYVDVTIDDVKRGTAEFIDPLVNAIFDENDGLSDVRHKLPFQYHYFVGDTEVDMIRWIFDRMHECQTSFIGVWNIGFDIPEVIKTLEEAGIPLSEVIAHPSLRGTGYDHISYREDKRQVAHFTQKWHWLTAPAHFQFVDSMALYSYIRMVDGKEASYKLNDILEKFGLGGKLKIEQSEDLEGLQEADWHRAMLSKHFRNYALYAMWDGMGLQLLEWLNNDLTAMMLLGDVTPPKFFVNQTIRVTNIMFQEWQGDGDMGKKHGGHILGTGVDVTGLKDEDLNSEGGAVLEPRNLIAKGMKLFKEWPNHATHCYFMQNDFDFSAQYPTACMVVNISKQTKIATMLNIKASWMNPRYDPVDAVEILCSYLITPNSNGVELGVDFFNLPDYQEMGNLFQERINASH